MSQRISRIGDAFDAVDQLNSNNARKGLFPFGEHVGPLTGRHNVRYDRFHVFDTNDADGTAVLPDISRGNLGRSLTIYNYGSGSVAVYASSGATIIGASSDTIATGTQARTYIAATSSEWAVLGGST